MEIKRKGINGVIVSSILGMIVIIVLTILIINYFKNMEKEYYPVEEVSREVVTEDEVMFNCKRVK